MSVSWASTPPEPEIPPLTVHGIRPAFVDKRTAATYIGSKALIDRMLWATRHTADKWLVIAVNAEGSNTAMTRITTASLENAAKRLLKGESPPVIPSPSTVRLLRKL